MNINAKNKCDLQLFFEYVKFKFFAKLVQFRHGKDYMIILGIGQK